MAQSSSAQVLAGYETTFITRSEISDDAQKALVERLSSVVANFGGEVVLSEDWGRRKMAYPIQKESRGLYTYVVYTGKGDVVHEMERNLRLNEHVLRFLTVNLASEFDAEAFRKRRADIHAAAKRREEEREARREERNAERRGYDMSEDRSAVSDEVGGEGSEE
jgi:small subunit ribosomal protein S6